MRRWCATISRGLAKLKRDIDFKCERERSGLRKCAGDAGLLIVGRMNLLLEYPDICLLI